MEIGPETPTMLFTTASIPPGKPDEMTLNLAGPIVINAAKRTAASIGNPGEEDVYTFSASKDGRYVIETGGKADRRRRREEFQERF